MLLVMFDLMSNIRFCIMLLLFVALSVCVRFIAVMLLWRSWISSLLLFFLPRFKVEVSAVTLPQHTC